MKRKELSKCVGQAIRKARLSIGKGQAELAAELGVNPQSLRRVEHQGVSNIESIAFYASAFGLPASELIRNAERLMHIPVVQKAGMFS